MTVGCRTSARVAGGAALAAALLVLVLLLRSTEGPAASGARIAPRLPGPPGYCSAASERAAGRAQTAREEGRAHGVRYAFDPGEGLRARDLLAEAVACEIAAGHLESAKGLAEQADAWTSRLDSDYRAARRRLDVAESRGDPRAVREAAEWLRRLVVGVPGEYRDFVTRLARSTPGAPE